jgi:hypothetical protein
VNWGRALQKANDDSAVIMTGGYEKIFDGVIDEEFFG